MFSLSLGLWLAAASLSAAPQAAFLPRARPYDVAHYRLEFRLKEEGAFDGVTSVTLRPKRALNEVELDSFGLTIEEVSIEAGPKATFTTTTDPSTETGTLTIRPTTALPANKEVTVRIRYAGKAGLEQKGLFVTQDPDRADALPSYFTQLEPNGAQSLFPCNDQPDDKATTEVLAVVDARYTVLSNGAKEKDEVFAEAGHSLRRVHFKQAQPHSTYLVALAIAELEPVEVLGDIPATLWVSPGKKDRAFVAADVTRSALSTLEKLTGTKYPWAKYDQVAVPKFIYSGMENTSLSFLRENALLVEQRNHLASRDRILGVISHELAHQWFGDQVTCRWWNDLWLNEGFAEFFGAATMDAFLENDLVEVSALTDVVDGYFREEDGPHARPLAVKPGLPIGEYSDDTAYVKGARVLRMLQVLLGKDDFKKGIQAYLQKYAHSSANSDEFFAAMGAATKRDKEVRAFRDAWLTKKGYPVLFPQTTYAPGMLTITVRQQPNRGDEKGPFYFRLPIVIHRESEPAFHLEQTLLIDKPVVTVKVPIPALPQWVDWNQDFAALARIETASIGEQEWIQSLRADPDPTWRVQAAFSLLGEIINPDAKEELKPSDAALLAVVDALGKDSSPYVREAVLRRLGDSRWKRLPSELLQPVLAAAKRPEGLPEDPHGMVRVRRAAMEALGKLESEEGRQYLFSELVRRDVDLNYLVSLAVGTARVGTSEALATLRQALGAQRSKSYAHQRSVIEAIGAVENAEAAGEIRRTLEQLSGNRESAKLLLRRLGENQTVKFSPEGAALVRDFVLHSKDFGEETKASMLSVLDHVRTPAAKEALVAIVQGVESARLKQNAQAVLERNFPPPAGSGAPATKARGKGK